MMKNKNRREFLKQSAFCAIAVSVSGGIMACKNDPPIIQGCLTTSDILGPFFREGAPQRGDLTFSGQGGIRINISGKVLTSNCVSNLEGATLDLWHANDAGEYDNTTSDFLNRGKLITGADGVYSFQTIMPGKYLNGSQFRPSHLHFKVSAPGHRELISQVYFKGDTSIENDPWASDAEAKLRILETVNNGDVLEVKFDISLDTV